MSRSAAARPPSASGPPGPAVADDGIRYTARINDVLEVALFGGADLEFWRAALRPEGLAPYAAGGRAELLVSATSLVWKGLRFRELVINVAVGADGDEARLGGFFLAHAFNSSSILACAERVAFKTPYYRGAIAVGVDPARIEARDPGRAGLFMASMVGQRAPSAVAEAAWSGPVFLPRRRSKHGAKFFVILKGEQRLYPFAGADLLTIGASPIHQIFQQLIDSRFAPDEWRIRRRAEHAKSKTYDRAFEPAVPEVF